MRLATLFALSACLTLPLVGEEISATSAALEVTLTPAGAAAGLKAGARGVAAAYGATIESEGTEEGRTFVIRTRGDFAKLMRGDPRIQSVRVIKHEPNPATADLSLDLGEYSYDGSGNIKAIKDDVYEYDLAGRLKKATTNGSANEQTYTYDSFGNRTGTSRLPSASACTGNSVCEMSAPVASTNTNHLSRAGTVYDDAGNITQLDTTYTYVYDALNMMRSAGNRDFIYTADDQRIATVSSESWRWTIRGPNQQVLREYTSSGPTGSSNFAWTRDHIWRGSSLLAAEVATSSGTTVTRHFHLDHLGTPRLVTNGGGQRVGLHSYYAFGSELVSATIESPEDQLKFTGHEQDDLASDTHELTYMHARYYNAALGRFLSVDPVLGKPALPQSWNRYTYVMNNPINRADPDGRCFWDLCAAEIVGAFALASGSVATLQVIHSHPGNTNLDQVKAALGPGVAIMTVTAKLAVKALTITTPHVLLPTSLPAPSPPAALPNVSTPGKVATTGINPAAPLQASGERNPAQDKLLTNGDIQTLQNAGHDIHELKGGENASKYDLYKDTAGNVYVKPKGGKGPGDETGINVKDLQKP